MSIRKINRLIADEKDKMTDAELFGSAEYRNYLQTIADNIAGKYGRGARVRIAYSPADQNAAYTDSSEIFINTANSISEGFAERRLKHMVNIGLLGHEAAHILFTDFPVSKRYGKAIISGQQYPRTLKPKQFSSSEHRNNLSEFEAVLDEKDSRKLRLLEKIAARFLNIIEDGYIEQKMKLKFPGSIAQGIELKDHQQLVSAPSVKKMTDGGYEEISIIHNLLLQYAINRYYENQEDEKNVYTDFINGCIATLDDALFDDDPKNRIMAVNEIIVRAWSFLKPLLDKLDESSDESSEENSNGDSEGDSEENSTGDSEGDSEEKSNGKSEDSSEDNSEESSEGSSEGSSDSSSEGSSEQSKDDVLEEMLEKLSKEMTSSSSQSSNMNTRSVLSGTKEDDGEEERQRLEHLKSSIEDMVSNGGGSVTRDNDYSPVTRDLDKLVTSVASNKVCGAVEDELCQELNEEVAKTDFGSIHKNVDIVIHRQRDLNGCEKEIYDEAIPKLKPISKMLQKSILAVIKQRQRGATERGLLMGSRLDQTAYYRGDGKIFTKRSRPNDEISLAVGVLVDMSGSMCGERIKIAKAMTLVVYDFCRSMNVPVTIYGHDTDYGKNVNLYSFAEFGSVDGNDKYRLMNIHEGGCNRDGCAVRFVAEKLCRRTEVTKLFIVVSDGQPADTGYYGTAAEADLMSIRKEYVRKGITFLAAAIGEDKPAIKRCYGDEAFLDITDLKAFPTTIGKIIARFALK